MDTDTDLPDLTRKDLFKPYKLSLFYRFYNRLQEIFSVAPVNYFREANEQFLRDRLVDKFIVGFYHKRQMDCHYWYKYDPDDLAKYCQKFNEDFSLAKTNFFIKYGELHGTSDVRVAYMKQKHRLLWERRHGEIGAKEIENAKKKAEDTKVDWSEKLRKQIGVGGLPREFYI